MFNNNQNNYFSSILLFLDLQTIRLTLQFKMSILAANPSVIYNQSRGRTSSKHNRNYQKVSEANLDQKTILTYLKKLGMHRTITAFAAESQYCHNIHPIIKIIQNGGKMFQGNIEGLVGSLRVHCQGKNSFTKQKWLIIQFYLHIWYCIEEKCLNKSRLSALKDYININGQKLSQLPQLLPYFALPFANEPISHPFLKTIFTIQWQQDLKILILDLFGKKPEQKKEQEWLNIIEDMIQICCQLSEQVDVKKQNISALMQRVNMYRYVIQKNKWKRQQRIESNIKQIDFGNISQVKSKISQLHQRFSQTKQPQHSLQLSVLYHSLQLELIQQEQFKEDKNYVKQLVAHDILCLQTNQDSKFQFQQLRLVQMLGSYFQGRKYLERSDRLVKQLGEQLRNMIKDQHLSKQNLGVMECMIDILRKMAIRPKSFIQIIQKDKLVQTILKLFQTFKQLYLKGSKSIEEILSVTTALLTQIVIHKQGRQILSRTKYLQSIVELISQMKNKKVQFILLKNLCSSIYLMLVDPTVRVKANRLGVKDILLDLMMASINQGFQSIVGYIIERIQIQGQIDEGDSDQDMQKSIEFDSYIMVSSEVVWHRGQAVEMKDLKKVALKQEEQNRNRSNMSKDKDDRKRSKSKRSLLNPNEKEKYNYSRQKYVRKDNEGQHNR